MSIEIEVGLENATKAPRVTEEELRLEETPKGVLLRAYDDDLDHTARFLIGLGHPFAVVQPPELVEALHRLARTLLEIDRIPERIADRTA